MASLLIQKQVVFFGFWRTAVYIDDIISRKISIEFREKPGVRAIWQLTKEGLTIHVLQTGSGRQGRTNLIPLALIQDVVINRYNPLCIMTVSLHSTKQYDVLVCRCDSERDAMDMAQMFKDVRSPANGNEYNADFKQPRDLNWTLKPATKMNGHVQTPFEISRSIRNEGSYITGGSKEKRVEGDEEALEREQIELEGRSCFNVGVQTIVSGEDDWEGDSSASGMSYQSLKDEIQTLSKEVRNIKTILQKSGISAAEYFRRQEDDDPSSLRYVHIQRQTSDSTMNGSSEKKVNFAEENQEIEFDIRSIGAQTEKKGKVKFLKRPGGLSSSSRNVMLASRQRNKLSSSSASASPKSPRSLISPSSTADGNVFTYPNPRVIVDGHLDPRQIQNKGFTDTIHRPIENVYQAHLSGFRTVRPQILAIPSASATVAHPLRRTSSEKIYKSDNSGMTRVFQPNRQRSGAKKSP